MPTNKPTMTIAPTVPPMKAAMKVSLLPEEPEEPEEPEDATDGNDVTGMTVVNENVDVSPFSSVIILVLTMVDDDTIGAAGFTEADGLDKVPCCAPARF